MLSRDSPYEERLAMLGSSLLQSRRSYLSLLECYKTTHGLNGLNCNDYLIKFKIIITVEAIKTMSSLVAL